MNFTPRPGLRSSAIALGALVVASPAFATEAPTSAHRPPPRRSSSTSRTRARSAMAGPTTPPRSKRDRRRYQGHRVGAQGRLHDRRRGPPPPSQRRHDARARRGRRAQGDPQRFEEIFAAHHLRRRQCLGDRRHVGRRARPAQGQVRRMGLRPAHQQGRQAHHRQQSPRQENVGQRLLRARCRGRALLRRHRRRQPPPGIVDYRGQSSSGVELSIQEHAWHAAGGRHRSRA